MAIDPASVAAGVIIAALTRAQQLIAEAAANGQAVDGDQMIAQLEQGLQSGAPQLAFHREALTAATPKKIADANTSPRRRVAIINISTVEIEFGTKREDLPGGWPLAPKDAIIDEPPFPHGGEWWAYSAAAVTILVGEQL